MDDHRIAAGSLNLDLERLHSCNGKFADRLCGRVSDTSNPYSDTGATETTPWGQGGERRRALTLINGEDLAPQTGGFRLKNAAQARLRPLGTRVPMLLLV